MSDTINNANPIDGLETQKAEAIASLRESLEVLIKAYRELLNVVRKEKEILIASRIDDLNENNKVKEMVLLRINSIERSRQEAVLDLSNALGLALDPAPKLSDLARMVDEESAEYFRRSQSVLEILVKRVWDFNKENEGLVKSALQSVTGAMDSIKSGLSTNKLYKRKGLVDNEPQARQGRLVQKEV